MSRYRPILTTAAPPLDGIADDCAALAQATHSELVELVQSTRLWATQVENSRTSHRRIGIATGVLMGLHRLPEHEAFETLRQASMNLNMKLVEVAEHVIATGLVPTSAPERTHRTKAEDA